MKQAVVFTLIRIYQDWIYTFVSLSVLKDKRSVALTVFASSNYLFDFCCLNFKIQN